MIRGLSLLSSRHAWLLLLPVLVLSGVSVLTIQALYATGPLYVPCGPAIRQAGFLLVGLAAAAGIMMLNYQRLGRFAPVLFVLCLALLAGLQIDKTIDLRFIPVRNNARRWIEIGSLQFQPSEVMKIAYVLALAWYLRFRRNYRTFSGLVPPFVLTLIPMALIIVQPDLGTVLLFLPVLFAMLYAAGAKGKHLAVIILLGILCLPLFWMSIAGYQRLRIVGVFLQSPAVREYFQSPIDRWDAFCPPRTQRGDWRLELTKWEKKTGYQLVRSKAAIGSGGAFGQGWGQGIFVEYDFLPERENDFIFAMVGHQFGLAGTLLVVCCYIVIVIIGFDAATVTNDPFGRLVAIGITTMIAVQALTNLCMTVGIGPVTGVTLPFLSKGGSSLVASCLCIGLLASVARHRPVLIAKRPFQFNEEAEKYEALLK